MQRFYLDLGKIGPLDRGRNTLLKRLDGNNKMLLMIALNALFATDMVLHTCQAGSGSSARSGRVSMPVGVNAVAFVKVGSCCRHVTHGKCFEFMRQDARGATSTPGRLRRHIPATPGRLLHIYSCLAPFLPAFSDMTSKCS